MASVLLVEDDVFKSDEIQSHLVGLNPAPTIRLATSVSSAIAAIQAHPFDLIILDMALPSHTPTPGAGAPLSLLTGGLEVLFELQSLGRRDPCLIVTQYPEIEICNVFYPLSVASQAIHENYDLRVLDCVEYAESRSQWRVTLTNIYAKVCAS